MILISIVSIKASIKVVIYLTIVKHADIVVITTLQHDPKY